MVNIDINQLTSKRENINSGIITAENKDLFVVTNLDIDDLVPSEDNFYSLSDIESLKDNIEEFGIQENLVVMRLPDKKYEIVSGHRRREACRLLVQEGKKKFRWMPCRIIPTVSSTVKNILLITMNSETRKKTAAEVTEEIVRLKILYTDYKKENQNFKGRVREIIADTLGISAANVGRHEKISNNLIPEMKDSYQTNNINFAAAEALAGMSADDQKAIYEDLGGKVTVKDIREYQEPKNMNIDGFEEVPEKPTIESKFEERKAEKPKIMNPTLEALHLVKVILERAIENGNKCKNIDASVKTEYIEILTKKLETVDAEIFQQMGINLFVENEVGRDMEALNGG